LLLLISYSLDRNALRDPCRVPVSRQRFGSVEDLGGSLRRDPWLQASVHQVAAAEQGDDPERRIPHAMATMLEILAANARSALTPADAVAFMTTTVQLPDSSDHSTACGPTPSVGTSQNTSLRGAPGDMAPSRFR